MILDMVLNRAKEILEDLAAGGRLGPSAKGARVVYAQTDSLFAHLPNATPLEARSQALKRRCMFCKFQSLVLGHVSKEQCRAASHEIMSISLA